MADDKTLKKMKSMLGKVLGQEHVVTDVNECAYYSQDVYSEAPFTVKAVLRPQNIDQLSDAVKTVVDADYSLFPRGGGMSYTGGYLPSTDKAVSLDMGAMNRVLEVNLEDMYVRVEAGCTWASLHDALKGKGVRTPFWGTLSGLYATVGGSVSQNSIFFGSGLYETSAQTVIGLKIVAADGRIVTTGSGSVRGGTPFFRSYGPDLTGIFTGDCGALGVKAEITLKLISRPKHKVHGSFSFTHNKDMLAAMSEISRQGLASECFGFDPYLQSQRLKRESLAKDLKSLAGVMKSSGSVVGALKKGVKLAVAGRGFLKNVPYSLHVSTENRHKHAARADLESICKIVQKSGGQEIENSIPTLVSANPFMPLNSMIGPQGERWAPVHTVMPHSKAPQVMGAIEALFKKHEEKISAYEIGTGYLFTSVGSSALVIEPVFFWPDALKAFHKRNVEASHLKNIKGYEEDLQIRKCVAQIRDEFTQLCLENGVVHFQIGKAYRYKEGLETNSFGLVSAIKHHMDPDGRLNPGALGLAPDP